MLLSLTDDYQAQEYPPYDPQTHDGKVAVLVPLDQMTVALEKRGSAMLALLVSGDTALENIDPYLGLVSMIQISFPAFTDGRGFTLATRLRRAGFDGEIRADGPLIPDQGWHLVRTGFTSLHLSDANRRPERIAAFTASIKAFAAPYQRTVLDRANIADIRQRKRA